MSERRYTDREVARVFERATELDRTRGSEASARGLSLVQLQEIGVEAGIDPALIARAATELGRSRGIRPERLLGSPPVARELRSVPVELGSRELGELVRLVDERVPAQGSVTEALGTVRWSARGRNLDRQVSFEPGQGETLIRVEERWTDRMRAVTQGLPAVWGLMLGMPIGFEAIGGSIAGVAAPLAFALVGWGVGRVVWEGLVRRSRARAHELAEELAEACGGMGEGGGGG